MFAEIRNDYMYGPAIEGTNNNLEDLFAAITIDGWRTLDDNEEGKVIATVIMTIHKDVVTVWHDNSARGCEAVIKAIGEAKQKLRTLWNEQRTSEF